MKLLFLTQVLDRRDAVLGFVSRWVRGLAERSERVRVVALEVGDVSDLPANVDVRVLGREGRLTRWLRYQRFLKEALGRDGFDTVLAHMVPRYALVAAGPARRRGARLFLWYTHKGVDERLRRAERRVEAIFTASPESLRLETPKKVVTGHGIDLEHFCAAGQPLSPPRLLSVGRLTPAKDPLTILEALALLVSEGREVGLDLVGPELAAGDAEFGRRVRERIERLGLGDRVALHGALPYPEIPSVYQRAALLINASFTGSVDKVVLEAMACERPILTCNESFGHVLRGLGDEAAQLCFAAADPKDLAAKAGALLDRTPEETAGLGARLRGLVSEEHEVDALMRRLVEHMGAQPAAAPRARRGSGA